MVADKREWTVPAPVRALFWWPGAAFVLVMVAPDSAAQAIVAAGAVLLVLGAVVPAVCRRLRSVTAGGPVSPDQEPGTLEPRALEPRKMATTEMSGLHRAA